MEYIDNTIIEYPKSHIQAKSNWTSFEKSNENAFYFFPYKIFINELVRLNLIYEIREDLSIQPIVCISRLDLRKRENYQKLVCTRIIESVHNLSYL